MTGCPEIDIEHVDGHGPLTRDQVAALSAEFGGEPCAYPVCGCDHDAICHAAIPDEASEPASLTRCAHAREAEAPAVSVLAPLPGYDDCRAAREAHEGLTVAAWADQVGTGLPPVAAPDLEVVAELGASAGWGGSLS